MMNARELRIAAEVATVGVAGLLLLSAALPTTDRDARVGLLTSSIVLLAFAVVWFHVVPERLLARLGPRRSATGAAILQLIGWFLLVWTGGVDSRYFVYYLLPIIASTFALRASSTLMVGGIATGSFVLLALVDPGLDLAARDVTIVRFFGLVSITLALTFLTRTIETTRTTLERRSAELVEHNRELETTRGLALRLARLRERDEIIRAILQAAKEAIQCDRVWLFLDPAHDFSDAYTTSGETGIERFRVDDTLADPLRLRAVRDLRTIAVEDTTAEPGISARTREEFGVRAVITVPLVHRGQAIGAAAFSSREPRRWTPLEIRLAETIAEGSSPAVATHLALDELREERERLARRTRVLEGLANLSDSLGIAADDGGAATASARNLLHTFALRGATILLSDPSLALLEPRATAGEAAPHPVVTGPQGCPAIRSGRVFRVAGPDTPVVCPHVAYREGTDGFVCMPLAAAGQTVGAFFLEPHADSIVDESLLRGASDRIALTIANHRVLETAQRQAVTDGLTGLYNRHFMAEQLRLLNSLATRHGQEYAAIAIDVDQLKHVNDTFGHEMGDLALRGLANALRRTLRSSDIPVKTGGDEFLVLLPNTGLREAARVAQRIRSAIEDQGRAEPESAITVSLGVAAWRPGRDSRAVLEAADAALYAAKAAGRDRVSVEPAAAD